MPHYHATIWVQLDCSCPIVIKAADEKAAREAASKVLEQIEEHIRQYNGYLPDAMTAEWLSHVRSEELPNGGRLEPGHVRFGAASYWISESHIPDDIEEDTLGGRE